MKKQMTIISAVLVGLVVMLSGNAWAERERPRNRGEAHDLRDREARSRPDRQWRGREDRRDRFQPRRHSDRRDRFQPRRHSDRRDRFQPRRHHDRRWKPRKAHRGPYRHWRHSRGPRGHQRPPRFRGPQRRGRWHGRHHVRYPVVEKHIYHPYAETESEAAPAEQFELAASVNDPSGASFSFGISHSQ